MLDQSFSLNGLKYLITKEDVALHRLWRPGDNYDLVISKIAEKINNYNFVFPKFHEKVIKRKIVFSAPDIETILALRKINHNIKSIYKVKQTNRNTIIHQVRSLLCEECRFSIIRLDIASCYESINRDEVLSWIKRGSIVSYKTRDLLNQLFSSPQFSSRSGVPRGLAISATLSELFLRNLDRKMRGLDHIYFYNRWVNPNIHVMKGNNHPQSAPQ